MDSHGFAASAAGRARRGGRHRALRALRAAAGDTDLRFAPTGLSPSSDARFVDGSRAARLAITITHAGGEPDLLGRVTQQSRSSQADESLLTLRDAFPPRAPRLAACDLKLMNVGFTPRRADRLVARPPRPRVMVGLPVRFRARDLAGLHSRLAPQASTRPYGHFDLQGDPRRTVLLAQRTLFPAAAVWLGAED